VAARLEPNEAAALLARAMSKTEDPNALRALAKGLSAVAARLEPKEAAARCGPAADLLTRVMDKTKDLFALQPLAEGLSAVAARLDPEEAAALLAQAMARNKEPDALRVRSDAFRVLARDLSLVLSRDTNESKSRHHASVVEAVAGMSGPWPLLTAPARLQVVFLTVPPPLPAQTLVDILKEPFCVGEARRLVLDQLSRHYDRPFADHWEFVRFAEERQLGLDLLGPPPRLAAPRHPNRDR
jgi:hypothetical protein